MRKWRGDLLSHCPNLGTLLFGASYFVFKVFLRRVPGGPGWTLPQYVMRVTEFPISLLSLLLGSPALLPCPATLWIVSACAHTLSHWASLQRKSHSTRLYLNSGSSAFCFWQWHWGKCVHSSESLNLYSTISSQFIIHVTRTHWASTVPNTINQTARSPLTVIFT